MLKRVFDIAASLAGLILLLPVFLLLAAAVKFSSKGPVFFRQERLGRNFLVFSILKFRTMIHREGNAGPLVSSSDDSRITRAGRLIRKFKLDELPQLINVLKGDMSIVGPRPEVEKFVNHFRKDYAEILKVRPGITDPASVFFRNENELLTGESDPEEKYLRRILPKKIRLNREYIVEMNFFYDLRIIARTLGAIIRK